MALCNCVNRSIESNCPSVGVGVLTVYAACYTDVVTSAITFDTVDEYITALPVHVASGYTSGAFFQFDVPFESSNFDIESIISKQNNNYYFNPKAQIKLSGLGVDVIKVFESFVKAKVVLILKTHGNNYYVIGFENGLLAESGNLTTGTAGTDFKGATLTLSSFGETKSTRPLHSSVTIASLLATV